MNPSPDRVLSARWVFPVSGPPLPNGTVTVRDGKIAAIQPRGGRSPDEDLGNVALIPGLVNAHTHLDLSGARGLIPPTDPDHFTDWLRGVIAYRRTRTPEEVQADIRAGLAECLRFGTTLIGDIAAEGASWDVLEEAQTRAVVFFEMIGLSKERAEVTRNDAGKWYQAHPRTETCRLAFSPHSAYSARRSLLSCATLEEWPLSIHLAESPGELELIDSRTGPFVPFLQGLGVWDESG
ncbi:MAG TPA: amidohydrolase family protein, partial [Gemmata sp.]|nr:amidohydrolase family protein [Gemmata sp.]